jgi:hypothetical protein
MEENRAYLHDDRTAVIKCPRCDRAKTVDVSTYSDMERYVRFTARCSCGHTFKVVLERRKHFRKQVHLSGKCALKGGEHPRSIIVKDLSRQGLRFQIWEPAPYNTGDILTVEFKLDNAKQTVIQKDVVIQLMAGETIGAEFYSRDPQNVYDKELGFYLL